MLIGDVTLDDAFSPSVVEQEDAERQCVARPCGLDMPSTPITPLTAVDLNRALDAHLIQRVEFVLRQRNRRRRDILDKVGDSGGSRDRHNDW
jgi:hypothetical protein